MTLTRHRNDLTPTEAVTWNPLWTDADRALIRQHLERLHVQTFRGIDSDNYIRCFNDHGEHVLTLFAGYLQWPPGYAPANAIPASGGPIWPLTTTRLGIVLP